ncbi:MAG: AAA family ATPase [Candidatus Acidiferrales bacterium]
MLSVRQNNEFVLVAGSIHPDTKLPYRIADDSPIIPMPGTLVDFILYLKKERVEQKRREKAEKKPAEKSSPAIATPPADTPAIEATVSVKASDGAPSWATADDDDEYESSPTLEGDAIYQEPGRNDAVSRFAYRRWVQEMCSKEELRQDVFTFNQNRCSPPLPDQEIESIINGKLSMKQIGSGLIFNGRVQPTNRTLPRVEPLKGDTVEEQMEDAVTKLTANPDAEIAKPDWNLLTKRPALSKPGPSWIDQHVQTASQLSCEPVKWVIHKMTLEGGVNLLCAEHGSYKSVFSLLMAKAMLTDSGFAGRKTLGKKLRVVYCDRENPEAVVKERLIGMGLVDADGKEIPGFHIWGGWPGAEFEPPELMDDPRLIEDATRHPETFYFFDSLSGFIQGQDENDNPKMHGFMSRATKLSRLCAGVQILHHTPKKGKEYWRGAASIIDKSDHAAYMEKKSDGTVEMGAIRFRACGEWKNRLRVNFSQAFPDGRLGLYIAYSTEKSGIASGSPGVLLGDAEGTTDAEAEIDFTKSDADLIAQAKGHIEEAHRDGQVLNQSQLASLLGIDSAKVKARVLCATSRKSPRPWQARAGTRGNSLDFYPEGARVPTAADKAAEKTEKRRSKEAQRIRTKRTGTLN